MAVSANKLELLQIADAVAREKTIDRGIVIAAMEDAIQKAARSRYGAETDVRAEIDPKSGEIKLQRLMQVVDDVEEVFPHAVLEVDAVDVVQRGVFHVQAVVGVESVGFVGNVDCVREELLDFFDL